MIAQEWPIAASAAERNVPARTAARGRLNTVRLDFFLDPGERLSEQERALMTAMLHCLIGDIAAEIRAALPAGWASANDEDAAIVEKLSRAAILDDPDLISLLLRRADEERIASGARVRSGRSSARALQGLISHENGSVSAAAMGLVLVRGRRRDRFGQCLIGIDDLPLGTAERLAHGVAAALRPDDVSGHGVAADAELAGAASELVASRQPSRSIDALIGGLVALLDEVDALSDELVLACAQDGEVVFLGEVLGRRGGLPSTVAIDELLSGRADRVMMLARIGGFSRDLAAGILASIGDLLGIADPGDAIALFDMISADDVKAEAAWLGMAPAYRSAIEALVRANG